MNTLDLTGRWTLRQEGKAGTIPAVVPGCVHMDLLRAKRIPDPNWRDNELKLQWIGRANWTYEREFVVSRELLANPRILLRCEGLDTFATIWINGRQLAATDNMFRTWEFDVRRLLRAGRNVIRVGFASPLPTMARKTRELRLPAWRAHDENDGVGYVRKQPCNFGWDWGICLVTCGIWRDIEIVAFGTARLTGLSVCQDHSRKGRVGLTVRVAAERVSAARLVARVSVSHGGRVVAEGEKRVGASGAASVELEVKNPRLWWPRGMGAQPLYEVTADLVDAAGGVVDTTARRIGLRTLGLRRRPDRWGESFEFLANGVPFFAKGANWIPCDAFAARPTREDYARLLQSAADANMNMLRAWGGGFYENDEFYDLCDELGLCVWQDFIFACSTYPAFDPAFLASVEAEAVDNVRRLRHHPCIALWCGNNELEQGLAGGKEWTGGHMSWQDYKKLFDRLLPAVVRKYDHQRDYWPGSPHTPHGRREDFNNPTCGDAHLWNVWFQRERFEWYEERFHRFVSEFGFQAFPEPKTVNGYTRPEDRDLHSPIMRHHQRFGGGNGNMLHFLYDWFRPPKDFDSTLRLTQLLAGLCVKTAVEHWRRNMPRTMGALYWQLNDNWPVASWASIDYWGRWKALHHFARRFYAPLLVSAAHKRNTTTFDLWVTSDLLKETPATLTWTLTDTEGKTLVEVADRIRIRPGRSEKVERLDLSEPAGRFGWRNVMLWLDLAVGGKTVSSDCRLLQVPEKLNLQPPEIATKVQAAPRSTAATTVVAADSAANHGTRRGAGAKSFVVTVSAKRPALWVCLELAGVDARFSDNYFHLRPGRPAEIVVTPAKPMTAGQVRKALRVQSLVDWCR